MDYPLLAYSTTALVLLLALLATRHPSLVLHPIATTSGLVEMASFKLSQLAERVGLSGLGSVDWESVGADMRGEETAPVVGGTVEKPMRRHARELDSSGHCTFLFFLPPCVANEKRDSILPWSPQRRWQPLLPQRNSPIPLLLPTPPNPPLLRPLPLLPSDPRTTLTTRHLIPPRPPNSSQHSLAPPHLPPSSRASSCPRSLFRLSSRALDE